MSQKLFENKNNFKCNNKIYIQIKTEKLHCLIIIDKKILLFKKNCFIYKIILYKKKRSVYNIFHLFALLSFSDP